MAFDPNEMVFDPSAFRAWLEQVGGGQAGMSGVSDACPVARWLGSRYDEEFFVTPSSVLVEDGLSQGGFRGYATLPAPGWVFLFAHAIDERTNFLTGTPITGTMALEELDALFPDGFGG